MVGRVLTGKTMDGDWAKTVEAVEKTQKGQVIVIDAGRGKTAVRGELASWRCEMKGIPGVVIEGAIRDVDDIVNIDFLFFTRSIAPNAGEPKGYGEVQLIGTRLWSEEVIKLVSRQELIACQPLPEFDA